MPTRRAAVLAPVAFAAGATPKMTLALHQFTSAGAGFRRSLEGWARAGIRHVEPAANALDDYLKTASLADARRLIGDLGLTVVSGAIGVTGLWDPNPQFAANLEKFKQRAEQFKTLGAPLVYSPCVASAKFGLDDYQRSLDQIRQVADVARQFELKVAAEFVRNSTFLASLPTAIQLKRQAAHAHFGLIFDCYHFWSGPSKFEDLDLLQAGDVIHAHLNDTQDLPRELLDLQSRVAPGDGVAPLDRILTKLARHYSGPISIELFLPRYQQADPETLARELRTKSAALFKKASV